MVSPLVKRFQVSCAQNKLFGLAAGFTVLILSGVVAILPPKPPPPQEYKATGILAYSSPPPTVTETGQALFEQGKLTIADERALINEQVIVPVMETFERKNVKKFIKSIEVKFPKKPDDPQVIQVNYTDTKEQRSENILQMLLDGMVEESRRMNTLQLQAQIEALTGRLQGAKRELTVAEQAFYRFMSQEASGLAPVQDGSLFSAISQAQQQQRELRFQLEGINSQMASITGQLNLSPEQAALASALSADPIIASLRAQILQVEKEITLSEQTLRDEHPDMVKLRQQLTSLDQLQAARAAEIIGTDGVFKAEPRQVRQDSSLDATRQQLANRLVELQTQQQALTKQLAIAQQTERQLRQDYERFPTKQLEQERLQQELTLKKNFHDFLQAKLVDARTAEAETVGSLVIAQPPQVQEIESTYSPPPPSYVIVAAGMVGSVVVGLGVILAMGMLDPHLYTTSEIQALLSDRDITLLGKLPVFRLNAAQTLPLLLGKNRGWLPQYELFRSNLRRWSGHKAKVVLITSVDVEEGKSTTAYNLAIAAAQAGQRTLLIEADLRSPTHAASLGVQIDSDAQTEPLGYYSSFAASTALVPGVANLYVIPSAGPQINAPVILESSELRRLVANARPRFDMVIVDTPALAECNDALLLQPLGDGLVIVMQPGMTNGKVAGSLLDQLIEAELPILGGVVNRAEEIKEGELFAELPDEPERPTFNGAMNNGDRVLPNTPSPQPSNPLPPRLRSR